MDRDPRLTEVLRSLVAKDDAMRREGRDPSFLLAEADVRDLIELGYLREISSTSSGVRVKVVVTSAGRAAGRESPVAVELDQSGTPLAGAPASPPLDDVLAWLAALEDRFPSVLDSGGLLANQALADFEDGQLDGTCRRVIELAGESLIAFVDPGRRLPQLPAADRIGMGSEFRVTVAGRDRLLRKCETAAMTVNQIITATNAQVAGGNITNFVSFGALLDAAQQQLDQLSDLDDDDRQEAQGIIDKLRSATTQVALSAAGSGGGTVIGAILMGLLHLH